MHLIWNGCQCAKQDEMDLNGMQRTKSPSLRCEEDLSSYYCCPVSSSSKKLINQKTRSADRVTPPEPGTNLLPISTESNLVASVALPLER